MNHNTICRLHFTLNGLIAIAALTAILSYAAPATASTFMSIDFESDTPGSQPATSPPGADPITNLWAIGGYAPDYESPPTAASGTIVVGNAPGISQGVILETNPANPAIGALWLDTAFNVQAQQLKISFDLNVLSAPANATGQPKFLNDEDSTAGILFGMNAYTSGGWASRFAVAPTSENGGVFSFRTLDNNTLISFFDYTEGEAYHLEFDVDYTSGTLDAYVDGDLKLSDFAFWNVGLDDITTQEFFFHLNGETGFSNSVAIDNISAQVIPEPASAGLAGLGLLGLVAAARRRRNG